jgi:hypothetical protein
LTGQNRTTGAEGMVTRNVVEIVADHVWLTVEAIDRMCLNVYVPRLQCADGAMGF